MVTFIEYKELSEQVAQGNEVARLLVRNLFLLSEEEMMRVLNIWLDSHLTGKSLEKKFNFFDDGELSSENITNFARSFLEE